MDLDTIRRDATRPDRLAPGTMSQMELDYCAQLRFLLEFIDITRGELVRVQSENTQQAETIEAFTDNLRDFFDPAVPQDSHCKGAAKDVLKAMVGI